MLTLDLLRANRWVEDLDGLDRSGAQPTVGPIGVQLQGAFGDERTLLEVAFLLADALPFARIELDDRLP